MTLLLLLACTGATAPAPAPWEGLAAALQTRDPAQVSAAARPLDPLRGQDPQVDRLLGDALANVLMRPSDGWELLRANPAPEDPAWRAAMAGAALRLGDPALLDEAWEANGWPPLPLDGPAAMEALEQISARALRDPSVGAAALEDAVARCRLLDHRPRLGRQALDLPLTGPLLGAARALGADLVVAGRPEERGDPDPLTQDGPIACAELRLAPGDELPAGAAARVWVAAASRGEQQLFVELRPEAGGLFAFATSDAAAGARWVLAAGRLAELGEGEDAVTSLRAAFGEGLAVTALPEVLR